MKLVVLGATGGIGLEVVKQAVERGHAVTAFVRSPEPLNDVADTIKLVQGDLLNSEQLARVIAGQDAVLSSFGAREPVSKADSTLMRRFACALTRAMTQAGSKRLVVVSVAFLFKDSIIPPAYLVGRLLFPYTVADASAMEAIVRGDGLDWTIVRPPELTNKPRTRNYRIREGHLPRLGFKISRADVADFMLRTAENHTFSGKIVGVSN